MISDMDVLGIRKYDRSCVASLLQSYVIIIYRVMLLLSIRLV
jgi:hypothetical protein